MKVAIEGLDGSGKTTVACALCERLKFKYVDKPFNFMYEKLSLTDKQKKDIEWRLYETNDDTLISLYYSIGILYACRGIDDRDIIFDRHFASNYYWHGNEENKYLHKKLIEWGGKPDLTIVLLATTENRISRLKSRNRDDEDLDNSDMYIDHYDKLISFLSENNFEFVTVDTNDKKVDLIIDECLTIVQNRRGTE